MYTFFEIKLFFFFFVTRFGEKHFIQDKACLSLHINFAGKIYVYNIFFSYLKKSLISPFLQVLPGLYVGNYRDSKDAAQLERFEITHILAIHDAARRLHSVSLMSKVFVEL